MKVKYGFVFAIFTLLSCSLAAQTKAIKINPFGLLFGNLNAGYEHVLSDNGSLEFGLAY